MLVTLDVSSLYTNIPHAEGIATCIEALNIRETQSPPTADLAELISEILIKNAFVFGEQHYLQVHGIAMGTRMAPSYVNLFMAQLERRLLDNANMKPLIWWRYIDDIFTIWCHGEASLETFVEDLNLAHPTIKFTVEWSRSSIPFLDTRVLLENRQLTTDLHVKPTDTHQYLAANSCHPRHCKEAIPFSQALRMRCIYSTNDDFKKRSLELKSHLLHRGYKPSFVQDEIDQASHIRREDALTPWTRTCHNKRVPLVVTYHPNLPNLTALTKNNLPVLHASSRLKKTIPERPLIAYRRPKNLRDLLVKAELKPAGL